MNFCKKCGAIMRLKDKSFVCACGNVELPEKSFVNEQMPAKKKLNTLMSEINPLAVFDHKCSECGFEKAQIASKGVQYTDEDEDVEFVCGRCGHHDKAEGLRAK